MQIKKFVVKNESGIHARPSSLIIKTASVFDSKITFKHNDLIADAKSVLDILMLSACKGDTIEMFVEGIDEVEAAQAIEALFLDGFSECY